MKNTNKLVICAALIAIAFLASKIKLLEFLFPLGGSITLFSMIIITLPSYFFGLKYGLISCICYSCLKFIFAGNIYNPLQALIDYGFSYICFAIAGFNMIRYNKYGLSIGYILGCILRCIFASLSGYIFFREYTPATWNPIIYVIVYNGMYIFTEMIISLIVINLPFINKQLKKMVVK